MSEGEHLFLDDLKELCSKASPAPWHTKTDSCDCGGGYPCSHPSWVYGIYFVKDKPKKEWSELTAKFNKTISGQYQWEVMDDMGMSMEDGEFTVAARDALPKAIAEIEALRQEVKLLKGGEFWTNWVYPEGAKPEDIQNELADYHFVMTEVAKVYCELTDGLLSKPNYHADVVISKVRECEALERTIAVIDAKSDLEEENRRLKDVANFLRSCVLSGEQLGAREDWVNRVLGITK